MRVYTVHSVASSGSPRHDGAAGDRFVFVRDGFHVWAAIVPMLWMLWHRLWLALVAYLALIVGLAFLLAKLGAGAGAELVVMTLIAILIGLEAATLRRRKLSRGRWQQVDVVVADNREAAERRFFDRHAPSLLSTASPSDFWADRGPRPPLSAYQDAVSKGIIGLFPQGGGSR